MDPLIVRYAIMAIIAAISGFFLAGFCIYTIYVAIQWLMDKKKERPDKEIAKKKEKFWAGIIGLGVNGLLFAITFPVVYSVVFEAFYKVYDRFF